MARNFQLLAAAATVAFLALGGAAFAMATGPSGGHPGGGPNGGGSDGSGPSGAGPASAAPIIFGCDIQADQMNLGGSARRAFIWRCHQGNF